MHGIQLARRQLVLAILKYFFVIVNTTVKWTIFVAWLGGPPIVAHGSFGPLTVAGLGESATGTFCGETQACGRRRRAETNAPVISVVNQRFVYELDEGFVFRQGLKAMFSWGVGWAGPKTLRKKSKMQVHESRSTRRSMRSSGRVHEVRGGLEQAVLSERPARIKWLRGRLPRSRQR